MRRREIVALLGSIAASWPLFVQAQQPSRNLYRIGYLTASGRDRTHLLEAFRDGLRKLGYIEGQSVSIEARFASGRLDLLTGMVGELIAWNSHVIVAIGTPAALVAKQETKAIPIVFATVADAMSVGLIDTLGRPGGNVTGLTTINADVAGKRLELLKELVPDTSKVGVLFHPDDASNLASLRGIEGAAAALGIAIERYGFRDTDEVERAFPKMKTDRVDAVTVFGGLPIRHYPKIAELAARFHLPVIAGERSFPEAQGLASYSASFVAQLRRAAVYVDQILKGARPADLPVEQPTTFEFVINLKVARVLGLTVSPSLLARADEVIE